MGERLFWIVLLVIAVGGGFYAGRVNGVKAGQAQVQQTANRFFAERAAGGTGAGRAFGGGQGGQRGGFAAGQNVIGTVNKIDGTTLTVTGFDGTATTVQLNSDATIRKEADGSVSDIHVGDRIVASGTKNGNVFQATTLQLGGLFGGRGPGASQTPVPANQAPSN